MGKVKAPSGESVEIYRRDISNAVLFVARAPYKVPPPPPSHLYYLRLLLLPTDSRNSDPGPHNRLVSPLHTTVYALHFGRENGQHFLPTSARVELCPPTPY